MKIGLCDRTVERDTDIHKRQKGGMLMAITFQKGDKVRITYIESGSSGPNHVVTYITVEEYEDGLLKATDGRIYNLRSPAFFKAEPE